MIRLAFLLCLLGQVASAATSPVEMLPDPAHFADCMRESFEELKSAAAHLGIDGSQAPARRAPRGKTGKGGKGGKGGKAGKAGKAGKVHKAAQQRGAKPRSGRKSA